VGHTFGLEHRFKKGNRANPGGRPSFAEANKAARAFLASVVAGDPYKRTGAEMLVEVLGTLGLNGDRAAIAELINRAEGTPPQSIQVNEGQDNLLPILAGMARLHAERFPEGAEDDDDEFPQLTEGSEGGLA
jgi:hypothetical protein